MIIPTPPAAVATASQTAITREKPNTSEKKFSLRSAVLSLAFAAAFGYLIPIIDFKLNNTYLGSQHFSPGALGALLLLVLGVNPVLGLVGQRCRLTRDELLVVYLSGLFSCLVSGIGGHNYWPSQIIGVFYYATPENKWLDLLRVLPDWMSPALKGGQYRPEIAEPFYLGLAPGQSIPWGAWIIPMLAWSVLPIATTVMTGCFSVLLRRQWSESEALAFPLLRLPLEMTDTGANGGLGFFWKNPAMWGGFGLAAAIQLINGLSLYFPEVPQIPLSLDTGQFFSETPWNQMGYTPLQVFPIAVGLSFLLTSEVGFSLWFFFLFFKLQYVIAYQVGYQPNSLPTVMPLATKVFTGYQEVGAYLAFAGLLLWSGREHYGHIVKRAFGRAKSSPDEREEALPYPLAFWGTVLSFAVLIGWAALAGVPPLVAMCYWGSYLVVSLVLARVLADSGLLFVSKIHAPLTVWTHLFGSGAGHMLGGVAPAATSMMTATGDMRSCLLPSWISGLKLASDRRIPTRPLWLVLLGSMMVAFGIAVVMHVWLAYDGGTLSWANTYTPRAAATGLAQSAAKMASGEGPQGPAVLFWTAVGVLMVIGMAFLRSRLPWFPLHPTGYVMGLSWAMHNLWLSVFLGWLAKVTITRFMGHESYRKTTPFFLGLALGDIGMMLFWLVVDGWQGRTGHLLIP